MRTVEYKQEGKIGYIIFNRPRVGNALNLEMADELNTWVADAVQDEEILSLTALIITGSGKNFMCGADIFDLKRSSKLGDELVVNGRLFMRTMGNLPPIIASIDGYALGWGLEVALSCDYIVASGSAMMGFPEIAFGLIPGAGGTQLLPQRVGYRIATEMILTGRIIDGQQALQYGLVDYLVGEEDLLSRAVSHSTQKSNIRKRLYMKLLERDATYYRDRITKTAESLSDKMSDKPTYAVRAAIECLKGSLKDGDEIELYDQIGKIELKGSIQEPNFELENYHFSNVLKREETQGRIKAFLKCQGQRW